MLIFRCVVCGIIIYKPVSIHCTSGVHNFTRKKIPKSSIPNSIPWTLLKALCPFFLCFLTKVDLTISFLSVCWDRNSGPFFCSFFFYSKQKKNTFIVIYSDKKGHDCIVYVYSSFYCLCTRNCKRLQRKYVTKFWRKKFTRYKVDVLGCISYYDS